MEHVPETISNGCPAQYDRQIHVSEQDGHLAKANIANISDYSIALTPNSKQNNLELDDCNNQQQHQKVKPTLKRYLILVIFCISTGNKSFQWIQVAAGTTKAAKLYGVDNYVINSTSVIFLLSYVLFTWPTCYVIKRIGFRPTFLVITFMVALGSIVKCNSCNQNGVWWLIVGQTLASAGEQLISLPTRVASVWFPDNQASTATALCMLGSQFGCALGFVIPQLFLGQAETQEEIASAFYGLFTATMIVSVVAFLLALVFFDEQPKYAPGIARMKQRQLELSQQADNQDNMWTEIGSLFKQIGKLLKHQNLIILTLSYSLRYCLGDTIQTLLNQMIKQVWYDDDMLVGHIGFILIASGVPSMAIWGRLLDRFHCYKLLGLLLASLETLALASFGYSLVYLQSRLGLYLSALGFGLFHVGSVIASMELAVELTYPAPEMVTSSMMSLSNQIFGTVFIFLFSFIGDTYGSFTTIISLVVSLCLSITLLIVTQEQLNRQAAIKGGYCK